MIGQKIFGRELSAFKVYLTVILCLIGLLSTVYVACTGNQLFSYFYCLATVPFVALPLVMSKLFKWKMNLFFYILFSFYTMGPLLGAVYNFYYYTSWWDDMLHFLAGTIFAIVGAQLAYVLNKNNKMSYMFAALFGVLLSMGIAVIWEVFEYSCDVFLHSDMQADTIINTIITKINRTDGSTAVYENIKETVINGQNLQIKGYLDIGLVDTMTDMIVETLGALVLFVYALVDKNKHPLIISTKQDFLNHC